MASIKCESLRGLNRIVKIEEYPKKRGWVRLTIIGGENDNEYIVLIPTSELKRVVATL